jgi:hypothetical protein
LRPPDRDTARHPCRRRKDLARPAPCQDELRPLETSIRLRRCRRLGIAQQRDAIGVRHVGAHSSHDPRRDDVLNAGCGVRIRWRVGLGNEHVAIRQDGEPARMVEPAGKGSNRKACGGRLLCTGGPALGGAIFTLGKRVCLGAGSLGSGPTPTCSGRVASSPHPAKVSAKRPNNTVSLVLVIRHPVGPIRHRARKTRRSPSCSLGLRSFPLHHPFLFAAHSANLRPPREGRNHAPDCHTNNRRDCVRRDPRCPARLPVRAQPGYVKLYPPRDTRNSHPYSGRNALSGASDAPSALSGASASRAAAID